MSKKQKIMSENKYPTQEEIIAYNRKENGDYSVSIENEMVDHPEHYGGKDNVYEAIKIIEAYNMNFNLGNVIKYTLRAGKKLDGVEDLKKAVWYLNREIGRPNK